MDLQQSFVARLREKPAAVSRAAADTPERGVRIKREVRPRIITAMQSIMFTCQRNNLQLIM